MEETYRFFTTLRVRFNETDAQGHVNFAWFLNYFDVALIDYLRALGYSYSRMLADGFDMYYVDAHASYLSPAYFDEILRMHCRLGRIGNTSMRFDFQIIAEQDGRPVSAGEITVVLVDRATKQKASVPKKLREAAQAYESSPEEQRLEAKAG